jgi:hypothetical protein
LRASSTARSMRCVSISAQAIIFTDCLSSSLTLSTAITSFWRTKLVHLLSPDRGLRGLSARYVPPTVCSYPFLPFCLFLPHSRVSLDLFSFFLLSPSHFLCLAFPFGLPSLLSLPLSLPLSSLLRSTHSPAVRKEGFAIPCLPISRR